MRVPDALLQCVVFVGIKDAQGRFLPKATGFVGGVDDLGHRWSCLITAEHVVSALQTRRHDIWIRTNLKTGGTEETRIDPRYWIFADSVRQHTDVALCPLWFSEQEEVIGIGLHGPSSIIATPEVLAKHGFGIGDEVAIIGLFRSHHGTERNIPIVRIGNIAMMRGEPIYTKYCGYTDAHLIEARSISGLSGSPVFISNPPMRIAKSGAIQPTRGQQFYLLGLMHGHFDAENLNVDMIVDDEGDSPRGINTGIGVVIPAEKIVETFFHPEYAEMRRKAAEEHAKKSGATPDFVPDEPPVPPASDANPKHREDFNSH